MKIPTYYDANAQGIPTTFPCLITQYCIYEVTTLLILHACLLPIYVGWGRTILTFFYKF